MGACAGKLRQAPEEKEAANNSLDCSSSTIPNGLPVTKCRSSDSIKKSTLGLLDAENRVQEADATEFPLRHQVSVELAQAVDHWETNSKILDEISAEELTNRYHQDTGVLLSAIEHLEQVRAKEEANKTKGTPDLPRLYLVGPEQEHAYSCSSSGTRNSSLKHQKAAEMLLHWLDTRATICSQEHPLQHLTLYSRQADPKKAVAKQMPSARTLKCHPHL